MCQSQQKKENFENILRCNMMYPYDAARLNFSVKHKFPSYDWVKNRLFKNLSEKDILCSDDM